MRDKIAENGTKMINNKAYAYEARSLLLDSKAEPMALIVESFNDYSATKLVKFLPLLKGLIVSSQIVR